MYSFDKTDELTSVSVVKSNCFYINFPFEKGKPLFALIMLFIDSKSSHCLLLSPMSTFSHIRCQFFDSIFDFLVTRFDVEHWVGENRLDYLSLLIKKN